MARTGINYQDVTRAAAQLSQQGKSPTIDAVRAILGTGSKSTIAPLLKEWKEKQENNIDVEKSGLPSELITSIKNLYDGMQKQADERIEKAKAQANAQIEESKLEALKTQEKNKDLHSQLTSHKKLIEKLELTNEALQNDLHQETQDHIATNIQQEAMQQRLEDRNQEILRLNTQLDQAQQNLNHYRDSVQKQRNEERADFEHQRLNLEQTQNNLQTDNKLLRENLEEVVRSLIKLTTERDQLQISSKASSEQSQRQITDLTSRYAEIQQSNKELELKAQALKEKVTQSEKQLIQAEEKAQDLTRLNRETENKVEELREKHSILSQKKAHIDGQFKQLLHSIQSKIEKS